jgi:hypothetical protein
VVSPHPNGAGCLPSSTLPGLQLEVFNAKLSSVALKQTGAVPWTDNWQMALGPTTLLATQDGSRFWMGVTTLG